MIEQYGEIAQELPVAGPKQKKTGETQEITAIVPVASDPSKRKVMLEKRVAATLRDEEVERLGIEVGSKWTEKLQKQVVEIVTRAKARTKAMSLLGRRAYSRGEIAERLERAGFDDALAESVADELVEQGWINDARLAEHAARAISKHVFSQEAITERLRARHLAGDVAEDAAGDAIAKVDVRAKATDYIRKKLGSRRENPAERDLKRVLGGLARKGFEAEDVAAAFRELGIDVESLLEG